MSTNKYFCLVLVLASFGASAARIQLSHFPPNPGVMPGGGWKFTAGSTFANPPSQRMWVDGVYGGARNLAAIDSLVLSGRAGALAVSAAQRMTVAEAAGVVGRCLISGPVCAVAGAAAAAVYAGYRIRADKEGAGLQFDSGQPPEPIDCYKVEGIEYSGFARSCASSPSAAAMQWVNFANSNNVGDSSTPTRVQLSVFSLDGCTATLCTVRRVQTANTEYWGGNTYYHPLANDTAQYGISLTSASGCRPVVDFENPSYSFPGGAPDSQGKCPSGRYSPISMDQATEKLALNPPPVGDPVFMDAVKRSVDAGGQQSPAEIVATGPESQTGQPVSSTTTSPTGTTTETKTPTYQYTYAGDTITYTTTNTTETCTGSNSCTVTTVTPPRPTEQDPDDPCTTNPNRAGCVELGRAPDAEAIKNKDIPVNVTVVGGFGADNASCPGKITLSHGVVIDPYGLVCTYMGGIRFALLGSSFLIACLIFIGRVD